MLAALGALLLVNIFSAANFTYGPFLVQLSTSWLSEGETQLHFPPVGRVFFKTHLLPVKLQLTLLSIDLQTLEEWMGEIADRERLKDELKSQALTWLRIFVLRVLGLAALGGGLALLAWRRQVSWFARGSLLGLIIALAIILFIYFSFNVEALQHPHYVGMLEAAPWIVGLVENGLQNLDNLGQELKVIAGNLDILFSQAARLEDWRNIKDEIVVLHISDIHNNLVALEFVKEIVDRFPVDMIVDTGDISDYGTALELELTGSISAWGLPYVYIPGNHDSPAIISRMQEFPNVILLKGGSVNLEGIVITGMMDPAAMTRDIAPASGSLTLEYQEKLTALVDSLATKPQIVAVHNRLIAQPLFGKVPLIIHGHDHAIRMDIINGTVIVDAGTSGAAGIRGFTTEEDIPYGLALLRFGVDETGARLLRAVDLIKVYNREKGFIIERRIIN